MQLAATVQPAGRLPPGSTVAIWNGLTPRDIAALTKGGGPVWHLTPLTKGEEQELLAKYNGLIAKIAVNCAPGDSWWYTWCSSRDRFHSSFLSDLELLARFDKACAQGLPEGLFFPCPDPYLAKALRTVASGHGVNVKQSIGDRMTWANQRVQMTLKPLAAAVKVAGRAFLSKRRVGPGNLPLSGSQQALNRTLFVTWIKGRDLMETFLPADTYFGRLPETVASPERSVVVFGDTSDGLPPKAARNSRPTPKGAVTVGNFLTVWGIIKALNRAFWSQPPISNVFVGDDRYLKPLVRRDFTVNRSSIAFGHIFENSLKALVKAYRPTQILHMCENNPWERACAQAARSVTPNPELTGYMHCAVLPSHTKILITEEEKLVRPRPSLVVCTGARASDIMVRVGGHSPAEVAAGCALRQEYLAGAPSRSKLRRPIKNVLVVLEGLPNMSQMVKFVHQALNGAAGIATTIRPHPSFPFQRTLADAGLSLSDFTTLTVSEKGPLLDDFERADLVIYKGSTAAMEAGYIGIPLVHVSLPNLLTDDPLFEVSHLKQVVQTPEELIPAIGKFEMMDDLEFSRQHLALREYIDEYLSMPNDDNIQAFFPPAAGVVG